MENKKFCNVRWGTAGHEFEYMLMVWSRQQFGDAQEIPNDWESKLEAQLGKEWDVLDRGMRIEIMPPDLQRTEETDNQVNAAIFAILGKEYTFIPISMLND